MKNYLKFIVIGLIDAAINFCLGDTSALISYVFVKTTSVFSVSVSIASSIAFIAIFFGFVLKGIFNRVNKA